MDALLGTMSNPDIAEQLGISVTAVNLRRRKLGIPIFSRSARWTSEMEAQLGTMSDFKVAEELGIPVGAVRRRREKLGIPSWRSQNQIIPKGTYLGPEAQHIYRARRVSQVEALPNTLTYEQWLFACEWFDNECAYCGADVFLTEDHLVPLSKGGPRTVLNILPCCWGCNYSKRAKRAHLWIYEHFGRAKGKEIADRIVRYLTEARSQWS